VRLGPFVIETIETSGDSAALTIQSGSLFDLFVVTTVRVGR
jgi:hypothetical protein